MGCEVTSVYNDEIIGKIGFSQPILDDLLARDSRPTSPMEPSQFTNIISNIQGFTQSFVTGRMFFAMVGDQEYTVYSAGRFIVVQEVVSRRRKFIANKDTISAFAVREKLCLVGLNGGQLVLWDLQFSEVKLHVMLPEESLAVTSISLTSKFLFATDSSQPNNFVFCYHIRTGKLVAWAPVPSLETVVRGIAVGEDTHVTACGDGVWFTRVEHSEEPRVVRGIFGHSPKTSMTCLAQADGYVISGGVDGYLYAWRLATLKCAKALKVHEDEITAIGVSNNMLVAACMNGKIKIYSYKVTKNQKKGNEARLEEDQQQNGRTEQDGELLTFVLIETYEKEGSVFCIAFSKKDPLLYYCQTRQGLLFQKRLPANNLVPTKKSLSPFQQENLWRLNGNSEMTIYDGRLYSIYLMGDKLIFLDIHKIGKNSLTLHEERIAKLQYSCEGTHLTCLPICNEIVYLSQDGKLMVVETFGKVGEALRNGLQYDFMQNTKELLKMQAAEKLISLNFILCQETTLLVVLTSSSVYVSEREGRLAYETKLHCQYEKEVPSTLEVLGFKLLFESECGKWREEGEEWRALTTQQLKQQEDQLCCKPKSTDTRWAGLLMGAGYILFPK